MSPCLSVKRSSSSLPNSHLERDLHSHPPPSLGKSRLLPFSEGGFALPSMCLRNCLNGLGAAGTSPGGTSISNQAVSPTFNLSQEYALALQTDSYNEIRSALYDLECGEEDWSESTQERVLLRVLQPNRECVGEALRQAKDNALTRLVSAYFDHSEKISNLCLSLYRKVHVASVMYSPLKDLLEVLPLDADLFTQSHCDRVYDVFVQFDRHDNPLPSPDSHYFSDVRNCFSQLEQQLGHRCRKSKSRVKFVRRAIAGSALCLFGTVVAAVASAIGVTAHALIAFVSAPCLTMYLPHDKFLKKELSNVAQLDAAGKGCALRHDLDSIHRLVNGLHSAIESHRKSIRDRLERGTDKNPILDVVEKLRKDHDKFLPLLDDLKNHIGLCLKYVNRGRKFLLEEITFHRSIAS